MHEAPPSPSPYDAVLVEESVFPYRRQGLSDGQFTLLMLLVLLLLFCFCSAVLVTFGFQRSIGIVVRLATLLITLAPLVLLWGLALRSMPEPTKYATVFGLIGFMLLAPLPCWIQQSRMATRQRECPNGFAHVKPWTHHLLPDIAEAPREPIPLDDDELKDRHLRTRRVEPYPDEIILSSGQKYPAYEP